MARQWTEYITTLVSLPVYKQLEKLAKLEHRSLSQLVRVLLEEALASRNGKKP
jgi:predicted CopG family antitoxin